MAVDWTEERREWARSRLQRLKEACGAYDADQKARRYEGMNRELYAAMIREEPTAKRILDALDPQLDQLNVQSYPAGHLSAISTVDAALGVLDDLDEVEKYLGPGGPSARAENFHSWIWQAAATFWNADQHAVAVEQAAKSLTANIQKKSGSTLVDRELAAEVFSPIEKADRTRLWLPGDRADRGWRTRQDGLHLMSQSAFAGIRNVVAHSEQPGWSQQEALEYLAILSTVARWTDETQVHRL